jgi:hypothetical protein
MTKPPWDSVFWETRLCFEGDDKGPDKLPLPGYGPLSDWPYIDCCGPMLHRLPCTLPTERVFIPLHEPEAGQGDPLDESDPYQADAKAKTHALYNAALALLRENIDIVSWVLCLVQGYSVDLEPVLDPPGGDMASCVTDLLMGRSAKRLTLTMITCYTGVQTNGQCASNDGAAGDALSYHEWDLGETAEIGMRIPVLQAHSLWASQEYVTRGPEAFCAVKDAAVALLHEVVHVCVKKRDGVGEGKIGAADATKYGHGCWQEARMVGSTIKWAFEQRYTCIGPVRGVGPTGLCPGRGDDDLFLLTTGGPKRGF